MLLHISKFLLHTRYFLLHILCWKTHCFRPWINDQSIMLRSIDRLINQFIYPLVDWYTAINPSINLYAPSFLFLLRAKDDLPTSSPLPSFPSSPHRCKKLFCVSLFLCHILKTFLTFLRATAGTAIARLSHRNSVRLSVRPSVCHTGGSGKNGAS